MINPFTNGSAVIPLCRAFLSFKTAYFKGVDNPALIPASNVALQIVPVGMVARKEGVLMRGLEFQAFLRGLYDRCEVMENTAATNTKPAVLLHKILLIIVANSRVSHITCNINSITTSNFSRIQ